MNNSPMLPPATSSIESVPDLIDSARVKAFIRLLPLLFVCYIIAYIDRTNVSIASLTMAKDLPAFDPAVFGLGSGIFFIGYFLLEIPGTIIVERWSARKWICRIMVTWGLMAAATAFVKTPFQFYVVRFLLGVAEAGFFPGVIVFLTHWFPSRDRARAISFFLIASPIAMMIGPAISKLMIDIGTTEIIDGLTVHHPKVLGMYGWQWIYIFWGIPAVVVGMIVLWFLPDKPKHARWLTPEERLALQEALDLEKRNHPGIVHMPVHQAIVSPRVLWLSFAYFGIVTANYGIEFFLPKILSDWYRLSPSQAAFWVILPSLLVIPGQLLIGWSSDRHRERKWHAVIPVLFGSCAILAATWTRPNFTLTLICFVIAVTGMKSYMPAFWSIPSLFLASTAAAGSVGMINSIGNLGGFLGPYVMGSVAKSGDTYYPGLYFLALTSTISAILIACMPIGRPIPSSPSKS